MGLLEIHLSVGMTRCVSNFDMMRNDSPDTKAKLIHIKVEFVLAAVMPYE